MTGRSSPASLAASTASRETSSAGSTWMSSNTALMPMAICEAVASGAPLVRQPRSHKSRARTPLITTMPASKKVCMDGDSFAGVTRMATPHGEKARIRRPDFYRLKFSLEIHAIAASREAQGIYVF